MPATRHVVFGAGQVGTPLVRALVARGHDVRVVKRSPGSVPDGAQLIQGDATDPAVCRAATEGAAVVYHCMNPKYVTSIWADLVPRYMTNLIGAASAAGARLVVLDNLYMLGKSGGKAFTAETPMNPCSRKGEIRARAAQALFDAHQRGEVRATTGRASDFYGPGGTLSQIGDFFWKKVVAGGSGQVICNPDMPHTYHYIPDVAAGLLALGEATDDVCGKVWMLPCQPAESLRDLVRRFERPLGRPITLTTMPGWLRTVVGLFIAELREMPEMAYQWEEPFIVDDSAFRARFGLEPEQLDTAAAATVAWARQHYARA